MVSEPSEKKRFNFEFTSEEIRLISYWRESCHNYNLNCPLHCLEEGLAFCHELVEKMADTIKKQKEES